MGVDNICQRLWTSPIRLGVSSNVASSTLGNDDPDYPFTSDYTEETLAPADADIDMSVPPDLRLELSSIINRTLKWTGRWILR